MIITNNMHQKTTTIGTNCKLLILGIFMLCYIPVFAQHYKYNFGKNTKEQNNFRPFITGIVVSDTTGTVKYKSEQLFAHLAFAQGFDVFAANFSPLLMNTDDEIVDMAPPIWICYNSKFEPMFTLPVGTIGVTADDNTGVFIYEYKRYYIIGVINQEGVSIFPPENRLWVKTVGDFIISECYVNEQDETCFDRIITVKDINGKFIGEITLDIPTLIPIEWPLLQHEETFDSPDIQLFYRGLHETAELNTTEALECFRQLQNCSDKDIRKSSKQNSQRIKRFRAQMKQALRGD